MTIRQRCKPDTVENIKERELVSRNLFMSMSTSLPTNTLPYGPHRGHLLLPAFTSLLCQLNWKKKLFRAPMHSVHMPGRVDACVHERLTSCQRRATHSGIATEEIRIYGWVGVGLMFIKHLCTVTAIPSAAIATTAAPNHKRDGMNAGEQNVERGRGTNLSLYLTLVVVTMCDRGASCQSRLVETDWASFRRIGFRLFGRGYA